MPHASHRRHAVTLIEVVMVIIVLTASAMVVPFAFDANWNSDRQVASDASHLRQALRTIRDTAILNQTNVTATMDTAGTQRILVQQTSGPITPSQAWEIWLDTDTTFRWSNRNITFDGNGLADRNLEIRLTKDRTQETVRVTVTGSIQ